LGLEAAGVVEAVGQGVADFAVGDRVTYVSRPPAAYADVRLVPAAHALKLPDAIGTDTAAAMMLKGLTAWYLLRRSYRARSGDTVLLYAAAGGVGLIAAQWARELGVRVIGVVSTGAKAELARAHGCAEIIMADEDVAARARTLTGGKGVAAVYDSVGRNTFKGLAGRVAPARRHGHLRQRVRPGRAVLAAGAGQPRFAVCDAPGGVRLHRDARRPARGLCRTLRTGRGGRVKIEIGRRYPLAEAAQAHRDLEARRTTGSTILIP
jgi:NADPH:quinone reductase